MPDLPLVGLTAEYQALCAAIRKRTSTLVLGPPGSGKSKVVHLAVTAAEINAIYVDRLPVLHELLTIISHALLARGGILARRIPGVDPCRWIAGQTSVHLKGLVWKAFEESPPLLILDHIAGASSPTYRFLQRLYHTRGACIIAIARGPRDLGTLQRLFWDPRGTITFQPLHKRDIEALFETATRSFNLNCANLDEFRQTVLRAVKGNPGKVVEMCRLAADGRYQRNGRVLCSTVQLDSIAPFAS